MKISFAFIALTISLNLHSQSLKRNCATVFYKSSDLLSDSCNSQINRISKVFLSNKKICVHYENGDKLLIISDSIWGYRNKKKYPYRLFNKEEFKILQISPVCIYQLVEGKYRHYYFSMTLDSKLIKSTRKHLREQLSEDVVKEIMMDKKMKKYFPII
jgi:hypothetical protein